MKITLESTTKIVQLEVDGRSVPARIWEGETERGVPVHAYITRICPSIEVKDLTPEMEAQFKQDLAEQRAPTAAIQAIPLRLIL